MKLSIIVPVYNVEKYLVKCLDSLLTQDTDDYEVVVVNDGSTDSSPRILERYSSPRLRVFSKANGGLSSARNFGLERAEGEYVLFVDSDDFISDHCVGGVNAALNGCDVMVFSHVYNNESYDLSVSDAPATGRKFSMTGCPTAVWNYVFKKSFLLQNKFFFREGIYHEDTLFTPMAMYLAHSVVLYDKGIYHHYLDNPTSTTHINFAKRSKDLMLVVDELAAFAEERVSLQDRAIWGGYNLSAAINNLMLLSYSCDASVQKEVTDFFRCRKFLAKYLMHSPKQGTRLLGRIASTLGMNIFRVYRALYRFRYGF